MAQLLPLLLLIAASANAASVPQKADIGDLDWWKHAVFYQIYPRSFKDSNGDGYGDLKGIESKLDHLVDLGVSALWLSPIYKSPGVDAGYDISDYKDVDPIFGDLDDFKSLLKSAHDKGLRVILDFVPNHSSDEHEWFEKSVNKEAGYENYYVWVDPPDPNDLTKPPSNWLSYFHGSAWEYNEQRGQYYLHQFHRKQPDLNYRDPNLVQEMKDVLTFWLDLGVDGFRVDIISTLFEVEGFPDEPICSNCNCKETQHCYLSHIYTQDQPETYDMVYQWRQLLDEYLETHGGDARIMMTESYSEVEELFPYYGNNTHDGAHFTFNFWFITKVFQSSSARDIKYQIDRWFTYMPLRYTANWVLGNHDQTRLATRYGPERVDGLNIIAHSLPGVAVTYQGEEFALENGEVTWSQGQDPQACNADEEDFDSNSRDFQRTPYHWDSTKNAGFSDGDETWLPVSEKYLTNNLQLQKEKAKSNYAVYKKLIEYRQTDTLKYGQLETLALTNNVLAILRKIACSPTYVAVINVADTPATVSLEYFQTLPATLKVLIVSSSSSREIGDEVNTDSLTLGAYEALFLGTE